MKTPTWLYEQADTEQRAHLDLAHKSCDICDAIRVEMFLGGRRVGIQLGVAFPAKRKEIAETLEIPAERVGKAVQRLRRLGYATYRDGGWW